MMNNIHSLVNYESKITLTLIDDDVCADSLIDLFFINSPHRTSMHIVDKLNKSKLDFIDKIPTQYRSHLHEYVHYLYRVPLHIRLNNYYERHVKGKDYYAVTSNNFPKKRANTLSDMVEFILECHPENLHRFLLPYKYFVISDKYHSYIDHMIYNHDVQNIAHDLGHIEEITQIALQKQEIVLSQELDRKIRSYYEPL